MNLNILLLPGDGIGPEIMAEAVKVLRAATPGHELVLEEALIGACALDAEGAPISEATLAKAQSAGGVLMGAVGHPKYDTAPSDRRPERGLLAIRKTMGVFANLRPVKSYDALMEASPLKAERFKGTDMLIVRELTGGLYFGQPKGIEGEGMARRGFNTMVYTAFEVDRITRLAFELAKARRGKVTSVDKANVLDVSQLWRAVVEEVAVDYPGVALDHMYVDNAAMQLVLNPLSFDVMLTENTFGDILSDEGAVLSGSIGLLPSASLGERRADGTYTGLYEPSHGSAPTIAGKGIANPIGTILSAAFMLEWSFGLRAEAKAIEAAVDAVIEAGPRTVDLGGSASTSQIGDAIVACLKENA